MTFRQLDLAADNAAKELRGLGANYADVVVADPARAGLSAEVIRWLGGCEARTLIYVSCNSHTMCRDLAELQPRGWQVVHAKCVDMFPQTDHLECVVALQNTRLPA